MPALPLRPVQRRDGNCVDVGNVNGTDPSVRTFSILFGCTALVVMLGCLIWGIILPKFRKTGRCRRPDRLPLPVVHDSPNSRYYFDAPPPDEFLREHQNNTSTRVRIYDPRASSPFPDNSVELNTLNPPALPQAAHLAGSTFGMTNSSHGLFTPARNGLGDRRKDHTKMFGYELNTITARNGTHESILPVPEPVLKPRPAGRPPPLARQLEKFPMPTTGLSRKGGMAPPGKRFYESQPPASKTSRDVFSTPCPIPANTNRPSSEILSFETISLDSSEHRADTEEGALVPEPLKTQATQECETTKKEAPELMTGLGTPKGKPSPKWESLKRAGTLTRPKTPVSELRQRFDRTASDGKIGNPSYKQAWTPTSNPFTTPGVLSTPPTSPVLSTRTKTTAAPSTPFQKPDMDVSTTVPGLDSCALRRTPSSAALPSVERLATNAQVVPESIVNRLSKRLYPANVFMRRKGVAARNLAPISVARSTRRHSLSSLSTILKPITARSKQSHCASSVYSHDTRVMSSLGSRGRDDNVEDHMEAISNWDFVSGQQKQKQHVPGRKAGSVDVLKSKIDEWDLHTADLDASTIKPLTLKRTVSDFGPSLLMPPKLSPAPVAIQRPAEKMDLSKPLPVIRVASRRSSVTFDSHGSGVQGSHHGAIDGNVKMSLGRPVPGTAPGGVDWI